MNNSVNANEFPDNDDDLSRLTVGGTTMLVAVAFLCHAFLGLSVTPWAIVEGGFATVAGIWGLLFAFLST